jgi:hypothetical protein
MTTVRHLIAEGRLLATVSDLVGWIHSSRIHPDDDRP